MDFVLFSFFLLFTLSCITMLWIKLFMGKTALCCFKISVLRIVWFLRFVFLSLQFVLERVFFFNISHLHSYVMNESTFKMLNVFVPYINIISKIICTSGIVVETVANIRLQSHRIWDNHQLPREKCVWKRCVTSLAATDLQRSPVEAAILSADTCRTVVKTDSTDCKVEHWKTAMKDLF